MIEVERVVSAEIAMATSCAAAMEIELLHEVSGAEVASDSRLRIEFAVGVKGDKPVKGVDYWTAADRLELLREVREQLSYDAQYDLTKEPMSGDISCSDMVYDNVQRAWRVFGEVRIAVPKRSDYFMSIALSRRFDEGNIAVGGEAYPIEDSMSFRLNDVAEVSFSTDIYVWIKVITVQGFRPIIVPTKVSDLENDLGYIAGEVDDEILKLK